MTKMEAVEMKNIMELREIGYKILKNVFYVEPKIEFIKAIISANIVDEFPFVNAASLIEEGANLIVKELEDHENQLDSYYEKLHWDYTRMFVGPNYLLAPPWESTYFNDSRLIFQEQTFEVREVYLKYKFIPKNYPNEPDDHIGCELDFMSKLSGLTLENYNQNNLKKLKGLLEDQNDFVSEHLIKWVGVFCDCIIENSETEFYKGFALILKEFITVDKGIIEEILLYYKK